MKRITFPAGLAASAAIAVLAISGCGGGTTHTAAAKPASAPGSTPAAPGATVSTRRTPLGTVLVDGQGPTLYLFEQDKRGKSTCPGGRAAVGRALTSKGKPQAAGSATAGELGSTQGSGGTTIVTYG